ncbi:unnamed protein product [Linum tenue]|uniref:Reverse transcriptase domain-containing protein n=1 Tax=Linum tenue TaxID=586396 RepID=A0AAV0HIM5_9ROSI|nr:unnamed protein product [Linum tenue]
MFKLDIEKAFDNVSWGCLFNVLTAVGFPQKWQEWIRGSVCSSTISTMINGEAKGFFPVEKGLRQGDPLSPGLFVLIMDVLSFFISKLRDDGKIKGFCMDESNGRGEVTHLLFADDTLIFCEASYEQVLNILGTLVCFQAVSGLQINLEKSTMFVVGDVPNPDFFASIFGCKWSSEPSKYLGFPLGAKVNSASTWDSIINKFEKRLEGWKARFLSLGGRLVLNNSVLNGQPNYYFTLFRAPCSVLNRIERIQRRFIWCGTDDSKRGALVRWDLCRARKTDGGLGVRDLKSCNRALLCKWLWKFGVERGKWWRELILVKFPSSSSEWESKRCRSGFGMSAWANITKGYDTFWRVARVDPGGGAWVSFWDDCWVSNRPLAITFPRVAAAASERSAWISDIAEFQGLSGSQIRKKLSLFLICTGTCRTFCSRGCRSSRLIQFGGNVSRRRSMHSCGLSRTKESSPLIIFRKEECHWRIDAACALKTRNPLITCWRDVISRDVFGTR